MLYTQKLPEVGLLPAWLADMFIVLRASNFMFDFLTKGGIRTLLPKFAIPVHDDPEDRSDRFPNWGGGANIYPYIR